MPPELRRRRAPAIDPLKATLAKKKRLVERGVAKAKSVVATGTPKKAAKTNGASTTSAVAVGQTINFEGFGGEVQTHDGAKTTLKTLVDESVAGVVLFTYPKASTPGCTTQACRFRDAHSDFTGTGFSVYGLSKDSPTANTNFKTKQKLPYALLCDPSSTLISAIGLKKAPAGTTRGVFVVEKSGKVLAAEPGSPADTLETAKKAIGGYGSAAATQEPITEPASNGTNGATQEDIAQAETAAQVADTADQVADTAEKIDGNEGKAAGL